MLFPGDALLIDGKRDLAIAQQASADVVVIGVYAENVDVVLAHRSAPAGGFARSPHAITLPSLRNGASEHLERCRSAEIHRLGRGRARAWLICAPNKPRDGPMRSRSDRHTYSARLNRMETK